MKKIFGFYLSRVIIAGILLSIQLFLIFFCTFMLFFSYPATRIIIRVTALFTALKIAVGSCNIPCRLGWIIGTLSLPFVFLPLYFLLGRGNSIRKIEKYLTAHPLPQLKKHSLENLPPHIRKQLCALTSCGFSVYENTKCEYLESGEDMFEIIKSVLEKAEKYIFMEFFIISKGVMWGEILEILKQKAAQGVKVYILRDDLGTICLLPTNFDKKLSEYGIECKAHNRFSPKLKPDINYRDHRKIIVCDGKYAVTGGANIADEYINKISPYGYWKDTAVYLEGEAANGFALMFVQMWNLNGGNLSYSDFLCRAENNFTDKGLCVPFGSYPSCTSGYSEKAFISMLSNAQHSVSITTPYLVPDSPLVFALCSAAESGIEVNLCTPHTPDKKYIHIMTRANYAPLLKSGVKIYEYTPGFIHAKSLLCDNNLCYVGSSNLDCRSLYLHFECGAIMYNTPASKQLAKDFEQIIALSNKICPDDEIVIRAGKSLEYHFFKLFSGLL